jgi:Tfp pilus assembly protein PilE
MVSKQRGITLMGFVLVLIVLAIFAVVAMNLFPVYNESFSVESSMKSLARQPGAEDMSLGQLQSALQKHFDINYVENVEAKQMELNRGGGDNQMHLNYEVRKPLVYNLDFVATFDIIVDIEGGGASASE